MKTLRYPSACRRPAGFTLIELMVVIAIIGLLAALTSMNFRSSTINAQRQKTQAFHRSIVSALERYQAEFAEYPLPRAPMATTDIKGETMNVGGSKALYQALTGDGTSELTLASGSGMSSNGQVDNNEINLVMLNDMPRDMWVSYSDGYMLVDGFGKPFQYEVPNKGQRTARGAEVKLQTTNVNNTYDLWSFAELEKIPTQVTLQMKRDPKEAAKWIKNW